MTDRPDNVTRLRPVAGNGNGNGHDLHGRVSALEARLDYLATKEDIRRIEALIAQREAAMLRWLIGILSVAGISLAIALIRTFTEIG